MVTYVTTILRRRMKRRKSTRMNEKSGPQFSRLTGSEKARDKLLLSRVDIFIYRRLEKLVRDKMWLKYIFNNKQKREKEKERYWQRYNYGYSAYIGQIFLYFT